MKQIMIIAVCMLALSCTGKEKVQKEKDKKMKETAELYLAGGCFWGTEHYLKQINGVTETETGYANGNTKNPTYEDVCTDETGFAETVRVVYNPEVLPLTLLLQLYFRCIDPTSLNQQGHDRGTQYRTGIYYTDKDDLPIIISEMNRLKKAYGQPLAVEVSELKNFYKAEDYHQDYLDKTPRGYCHLPPGMFDMAKKANAITKGMKEYAKPDEATLKEKLTPIQYEVTQHAATEHPFDNEYDDEFREGIYVDITTGEPLFLSTDKFNSGCGWPAFSKPIDNHLLQETTDTSHGMLRTEVKSRKGGAHLGHVFTDGPLESGGLRYCINSASLRFIPKENMEKEGYGAYIELLRPLRKDAH